HGFLSFPPADHKIITHVYVKQNGKRIIAGLHNQIPLPSANANRENPARSVWSPVLMHFAMEAFACLSECLSDPFESLGIGPCRKILDPHLRTVNQREHIRGSFR